MRRIIGSGLALVVLGMAMPRPVAAATPGDMQSAAPWTAWIGCWRAAGEQGALGGMVCVLPGADANAVRFLTVEDDAVVDETTVHAGAPRAIEEGGCTGTQQASWSRDGRRVFLRTELDCDGMRRLTTGVLALVAENEWVDVQALHVFDQHATRTIRYRAVHGDAVPAAIAAQLPAGRELLQEAARMQAAASLDLPAVVEASERLPAPAVEALLAARGDGFRLDAATLVQLERQGVAPSTIDMMIALSYPERFAVRAPDDDERSATAWLPARSGRASMCFDPMYPEMRYRAECAHYFGLNRYRYGGLYYGYSPWGYDPYGWYYGRGPGVIIVRPGPGESRDGGAAVKGRGYTRGSNPSSGSARPRSGNSGGGEARGTGASRPSNPPSAGSSDTGSNRTDTGRTARPRGGGEQ